MGARQRRARSDNANLPPAIDEVEEGALGREGARIYREMEEEMVAWVAAGEAVTAANAMVKLLRLQQITGGALPVGQEKCRVIDAAKETMLADLLSDLMGNLDEPEPVVVFARFRADLEAIHRAAQAAGHLSGELSGARDDLAYWQKGGRGAPTVLAVQIQAGGVGIDLTRARIAVYYSLGFSLADYLQSRARVLRPPQRRPVAFYYLQIRNSIDQYVQAAVERRQDLIESVLNELRHRAGVNQCQPR